MSRAIQADIDAVQRIEAVPKILEVVCRTTGMGFAAVARVTEDRWVCCAVRDEIAFGLVPGGELQVETTICHEIRQSGEGVIIDHVAEDGAFCGHHTPAQYGFQSYISIPIIRADGSMFGTLCAIDPKPHRLNTPETIGMFNLFAELIAVHLDAMDRFAAAEAKLLDAQQASELREQFIAVLGHDLRNPVASISAGTQMLAKTPLNDKAAQIVTLMQGSVARMSGLIDNVLDFARGRLGGGLTINRDVVQLKPVLEQVTDELRLNWPERDITVDFCVRRSGRLRPQQDRAALFESSGQRLDAWRGGPADSCARGLRCNVVRAVGVQCRRADSRRRDGAAVRAVFARRGAAEPARTWPRTLHRL